MKDQPVVAYYRVSTQRQGVSGLGLEAQRHAVQQHLSARPHEIIAEFIEIESGRKNDRPKLAEAIELCRKRKATLVIAKFDRLSRSVHFISGLIESGIEFTAADNPHANKMMVQLLAVFAEHEREQISKRTKEALAAAKARGVKLGAKDTRALSNLGNKAIKDAADEFAEKLRPIIAGLRSQGIESPTAIAEEFNRKGVATAKSGRWSSATTRRLLKRLG
tara:strand:+ start:6874 stop:7533 length:660 start_codon:yes stop_codon:yes gene_type:complete